MATNKRNQRRAATVQRDNPPPRTPPSPNVPYPNTLDGTINPLLLPNNADAGGGHYSEESYDKSTNVLTQETTVQTPLAEEPTRDIVSEANALLEYVSALGASYAPWLGTGYVRQLPQPTDELMRDFGTRLYDDDMTRDAQVYSVLSILVMAILAEGIRLEPPISVGDPKYDVAKRIDAFCQYNLDNTHHPFIGVMYELVEGMLKMGHKVAELIYELRKVPIEGINDEVVVLCDVKPKYHGATAFVVDGFNNVLGLLYVKPGMSMPVLGTLLVGQTDVAGALPSMVPRKKFLIPVNHPRNGDPRGTSHLKAVYTPWWEKVQMVPQHMAYVARFAQPSIWIKLPPEAKDIPITAPNGDIVGYKSIVKASTEAGAKLKGGAVAAFVNADLEMLEAKSKGEVIFNSIDTFDRQIAKGVLFQTLTTEEGQHMARAASATHQDVFGIAIAYFRRAVEWHIREDVLKPLVEYNFGEEEASLYTPTVSLGDTEQQDLAPLINAIAALALAGGVHPSQWPGIWEMFGFPKANDDEWQTDQKILEAERENNLKLAQNPPPPVAMNPAMPQTSAAQGGQGAQGAQTGNAKTMPPPAKSNSTPTPNKGPADGIRKKQPARQTNG